MTNTIKLVLGLTIIVLVGCKTEEKFDGYQITGTVKGVEDGYAKILKMNMVDRAAKREVLDSVAIVDSKFYFEGKTDAQDMVTLLLNDKHAVEIFLENTSMSVDIDPTVKDNNNRIKPIVNGSTLYDMVIDQRTKIDSLFTLPKYDIITKIQNDLQKAKRNGENEKINELLAKLQSEEISKLSSERANQRIKSIYDFVEANPSSPAAPNIMGFQYTEGRMSKENLKKYYTIFQGDAKKTAYFQFYNKIHNEVFVKFAPGAKVPDFTLNTVDGEELTLSKVEGKLILIDFWASWCVPCRASFPHLKELYKEYKDKGFEVVAIGTADEEDKWRKAIEVDQTPWIHVYDANPNGRMYGPVAQKYSVPHLPTTFLIDGDGKIVLRQPEKEELDKKLAELFK